MNDFWRRMKVLTWLQAAPEVEQDHQEAAQEQGEHQTHHFCFSHAESSWGGGGGGTRRAETRTKVLFFLLDHRQKHGAQALTSVPSVPAGPALHPWMRSCGKNRARLHRPGGPTGGHWQWLRWSAGKVPWGVVEAGSLFNPFLSSQVCSRVFTGTSARSC